MDSQFTQTSAAAVSSILYGHMTPQMAAEYLREGRIAPRSFSQTLLAMYSNSDILDRIMLLYLVAEPDSNQRSLRKKIQNWLNDRNAPTDREDYYKIAFALHLSEEQLNYLLSLFTDYGIQYRNSRELVLSWFLRGGYGYLEALEFYRTLPPPEECDILAPGVTSHLTHELHNAFLSVNSLDGLRQAYLANQGRFGRLHLRSYYFFERYLDHLIHPSPDFMTFSERREPDYSIESVMEIYLSLSMPSGRSRTGYSVVQKLIKQNWPNTTAIKNIRNHVEDVPRKLLLLLYVVTENCDLNDGYLESDETYVSLEDRVQDHWWTINGMLSDCGMATLDMRNPFDWLILFAIAADPEQEAMSERLEQVIESLFSEIQ